MDKTVRVVEQLVNWQTLEYEKIESASDIKVFNVIGVAIGLLKSGYMSIDFVHDFVTGLSIKDEEKARIYQIYTTAHANANKEEI